jgi:hypothetical protein
VRHHAAMKIGKLTTRRTLPCFIITFLGATLVLLRAQSPSPETKPDPWTPLRSFIGHWEGESHGEPGHGKAERTYTFTLNNRFIQETHKSVYPPQEKNPKGETHEHVGFFSYDKAAKKLMLRQFHIESFVSHYTIESISEDGRTLVFVSGAPENFMAGWRGRETYRFLNNDEFIETFALAPPGQDFATYSETRFRRKK